MGRIDELIVSNDGKIRAAKIKTANGQVLKRPLNLLHPMELSEYKSNNSTKVVSDTTDDKKNFPIDEQMEAIKPRRSTRESSKNARIKIQLQASNEEQ